MPAGTLRDVTLSPGVPPVSDVRGSGAAAEDGASTPRSGPTLDPYIGATIDGRYTVERKLGEGGMGVVYKCRHAFIEKRVAMKVLKADMAQSEEHTARFLNEARSASSVGNPHIIDVNDFGRLPDGATYFTMEFLEGTSMADLVETSLPLELPRVAHISLQLTEALEAAHEAGIVHRDLKPDNIFLIAQGGDQDFVKLLDFGIAKASRSQHKLTQAGQVFGTPHYMSPEQANAAAVDHRSDIYSLGVILYELVSGHLPFDAENFMAILTAHMYKAPIPLSKIAGCPALPAGLENVILTCMAKKPDERYQSMKDLGDELRRVFSGTLPLHALDARTLADSAEDFARSSMASAPVSQPQTQHKRSFVPGVLVAALAGVAATIWAVLALSSAPEADNKAPHALPPRNIELVPVADSDPAPQPQVARETPELAEPASTSTQVAIAVAPLDAHVFENDVDLGPSPVMVQVEKEPLELEARLAGFRPEKLTIDGSQTKVTVQLRRVTKAKARPKPAAVDSDGLVNPW